MLSILTAHGLSASGCNVELPAEVKVASKFSNVELREKHTFAHVIL